MSLKLLPSFTLRSGLRDRIRLWAREQFTHAGSERADTFVDAARPLLKAAGISGKDLRRAWALGERSEQLARLRDRVLDQIDDTPSELLGDYARRMGLSA